MTADVDDRAAARWLTERIAQALDWTVRVYATAPILAHPYPAIWADDDAVRIRTQDAEIDYVLNGPSSFRWLPFYVGGPPADNVRAILRVINDATDGMLVHRWQRAGMHDALAWLAADWLTTCPDAAAPRAGDEGEV